MRLVVIGGGGFGREVLDVIEAINDEHSTTGSGKHEVVGVIDDDLAYDDSLLEPYGVPWLGGLEQLAKMPADVGYVIAVGNPTLRRDIDRQIQGRECPVLVHPSATIARNVTLGAGAVVCSHVSITNTIRLGRHVHVNLNCTIGHDATLGDYVTLSPLVAVSGGVTVGEAVFVGTGVSIGPRLTIGAEARIGAGAAVLRDVTPAATAVGVPAKERPPLVAG